MPSFGSARSIAIGGAVQSFAAETEAVLEAGGTPEQVVGTLLGVASVVGTARVVAAAPTLALALGFDTDEAFEGLDTPSDHGSSAG